ncbi:hypothetical protein ABT297_15285 [Dactylosporangium sp. NPDC000555]|uniref:hypothetical protein n=1 Tax=Dactylosporangium sp. NPDC000555 TaxID=3154260 RepID=UPI00332497BD
MGRSRLIRRGALVTVVLAVVGAVGVVAMSSASAASTGSITGIGGKCVDVAGAETVTVADFRTMLAYAQQHHIARFTFWSANRDRPCTGGGADTCSGVSQAAWDYTRVIAQYQG